MSGEFFTMILHFSILLLILNVGEIISVALLNATKPLPSGRIVGGQAVQISDVPYQVSLQYGSHFCGGSLIDKKIVLTAGHCTMGIDISSVKVRIGSSFTTKGGVLVNIKRFHRHSRYNPITIDYDFALLELEDYIDDNIISGKIKLPSVFNASVPDGTPLTVSGWGYTQNPNEPMDILRAVSVPKVNQDECNTAYTSYGGITDRMICAGLTEGGKDACQGDSGGPLVSKDDILIGVVSWGFGCAKPHYPGVYSRVSAVRKWIRIKSGI